MSGVRVSHRPPFLRNSLAAFFVRRCIWVTDIYISNATTLRFLGRSYRCAIGENGFTDAPKEGARKTPIGRFALRSCWYRTDRLAPPVTKLPLSITQENDGWCDDPSHPEYNRHVKLPFSASHEQLWREDAIY